VILYWKRIWSGWNIILKIATAFVPTAIIGLIFYKLVKNYLMDNTYIIAAALLIGGIILILFEKHYQKKDRADLVNNALTENRDFASLSYKQAGIIGIFQALAIVPGVSRAAATIIGGLALGIKRKNIVEFSFLLAIPTMLAATGWDLYKSRAALSGLSGYDLSVWVLGFICSFITAIIGVKFFIKFIQKNNFISFGWYRIALGLVVLGWLFLSK
jgi:undecaprenyl-diphosphatase